MPRFVSLILGAVTAGLVTGVTVVLANLLLDKYVPVEAQTTDHLIFEGRLSD